MRNTFIKTLTMCALSSSAILPLTTIASCGNDGGVVIKEEEKAHDTNINGQALFRLELKSDFDTNNVLTVSIINEQSPDNVRLEVEGLSRPKKHNKEIFTVIDMQPSPGSSLTEGEISKFDLKFTCSNTETNAIIWESTVSGLTTTYAKPETSIDTDWDGLTDDIDPEPNNNIYNGMMDCYSKQPISFPVNYNEIINSNPKEYNVGLAKLAAILYADSYGPSNNIIENQIFSGNGALSKLMGCTDWEEINLKNETYTTDPGDTAYCTISHRDMKSTDNKEYKIVFISFEGTAGNPEWISDFDVGEDSNDYYSKTGAHPDWRVDQENNKLHTKGVCVAKNRIVDKLESDQGYFKRHNINIDNPDENVILFITGHSRGGAMANLLSAHYVDKNSEFTGIKKIYGYCFATPYTTFDSNAKADKYKCIHCIVNDDDFIGKVPFQSWGLYKYGQEHICYISRNHKEEWENNWSSLDDGKQHTYYHFDHFLDNIDTLPVDKRNDLYNLDVEDLNPKQIFTINLIPYLTKDEANAAKDSMAKSLENLHIEKDIELSVLLDPYVGGFNIWCANCGGALIDLVANFFNGSEIDIADIINILPTLKNYFDYALPLAINLLGAIIESGNDNFLMDFGNCCHHCPTYYFAATHIDEPK